MPNMQQPGGPENKLWVTFKLDEEDYCISNEFIIGILQPTEIKEMPNKPPHMRGVMKIQEGTLPIVDLRTLLGMPTMEETVDRFSTMRQMHVDWVNALQDSVENHVPFEKAVNPHKCMFGKWYDSFHTDNVSMRFVLGKIGAPHEYIHVHGGEAKALMEKGDWDGARQKYEEARAVCTKEVLPLLDQLIATYKEVNRGIVITVHYGSQRMGLMADEIGALIPAEKAEVHPVPTAVRTSPYIEHMVLADGRTYAALNIESIAKEVDDKEAIARELDELRG